MKDVIFNEVSKILFSEWDPMSVGENAKLSDEYDTYARHIANMLRAEYVTEADLYALLEKYEIGLGMFVADSIRADVAKKLWAARVKRDG